MGQPRSAPSPAPAGLLWASVQVFLRVRVSFSGSGPRGHGRVTEEAVASQPGFAPLLSHDHV